MCAKRKYTYIDLFAGTSALSEGFLRCGFVPVAHVEMNTDACYTIKTRLAYHYLKENNLYNNYLSYLKHEITREELYRLLPRDLISSVINKEISDTTIKSIFDSIDFVLEQYFKEWVLQLGAPDYNQRVQINKNNSYFINFNYTTTLETAYGINRGSICYIHGCATLNQYLIFGHNQTPEAIKNKWHFYTFTNEKEQLEEAINDMGTLYKDVNAIIKNNNEIWEKLSDIDTIHVWGLSLSDVDFPYLKHIKSIVNPQAKWEFSWYNGNDKKRIENVIEQLSLRNTSLIQLSDIILSHPKQLNLFK